MSANPIGPLNIAVIGAGYWGKKVIREILDISRSTGLIRLHSIVDNSPTSLEQCRQEFGPVECMLDYRPLLSRPDLNAVHISTPNHTHFEVASSFLQHGKNVLVEKPLTLKSKEAYELVQLAQEKGLVLCSGHIHRFNNGVKELKRAIAGGLLGKIFYLRLRWTGFLMPQRDREVITDLAPHPFDICNYLLGDWPEKITCRGKGYRTRDREEVAFLTTEYSNDLSVHTEVSWLDREKHREVTVVGSDGVAILDCSEQKAVLVRPDRTEQVPITPSNTLREEVLHFTECIGRNRRSQPFSNQSDGMLGAQVVRLLEAARESLHQGRTQQVQFPTIEEVLTR